MSRPTNLYCSCKDGSPDDNNVCKWKYTEFTSSMQKLNNSSEWASLRQCVRLFLLEFISTMPNMTSAPNGGTLSQSVIIWLSAGSVQCYSQKHSSKEYDAILATAQCERHIETVCNTLQYNIHCYTKNGNIHLFISPTQAFFQMGFFPYTSEPYD